MLRSVAATVLLFLACALSVPVSAQQGETPKILTVEHAWIDAYKQRDAAKMNDLLSDDYVITVEDGNTYGKVGYISHTVDPSVKVDVAQISDVKVRMHGTVAVLTGAYEESGLEKGKHYDYHDRFTDVWMKVGGKWELTASHFSIPVK